MATYPSLSVQSLDKSLKDLVHWERVAIHLPEISQPMIDVIKKDHPGNNIEQKLALYDTWLRACPHATWSNVVDAVETAEEMRLARQIQHKVHKAIAVDQRSHPNDPVVISEKVEESVVTNLRRLNKSFKRIEDAVEDRCHQLVTTGLINVDKLLRSVHRSRANHKVRNLQGSQDVSQFFEAVRPHYTFLDCDLLEEISEDLPDSADVCSKVCKHKIDVRCFKRETPIRALQNKLKPLVRQAHLEEISLKVYFELEEAWGDLDLNRFELFLETMFPGLSTKMKWYKIVPGSICITFITDRDDEDTLVSMGKEKQGFLHILGVASLFINGKEVFNQSKSKRPFSFEFALFEASLNSNTEALLFLFNKIHISVNHQDKNGNTAFDVAVDNNCIEAAQILLNAKANLNHQRDDGNTPLHIACYKGYIQLALMLIKYGANLSIPNTKGDTPFLSSIRGNMIEVVTVIAPKLPQSQIPPALLLACRLGYSNIISFLLQYINPPGSSTIHQYCANGDLALTAEHIVQFSKDINSSLVQGITPLMIASSCARIEVVECLMEANADVNRIDEDGYSPLAYAITGSGSVPVIEYLFQAGANPCITVGENSLLQMAKQQGNSDLVDLLLQFTPLQLYNMFLSLVEKIKEDLTSEIDQLKITIQEIKSKLLSDPEFSHIEGIAVAASCSELFTVLQPHYDFLSWKVISCLSERLKCDGYFRQVEMLERDLAIQSLPQAASLFPQSLLLPSLSSTGVLSISLDKQWGDKTLFNLRGLNALLFSSLAHLMSHLIVSVTQQEISVSYQIPRSTKVADRIKSIISQKDKLPSLLGITSIKLNNAEVILQINQTQTFSFNLILSNLLDISSLPSTQILKIAKFLLKFKSISIDYKDADGMSALHKACSKNNKPVVDLLLSYGASPCRADVMVTSMHGFLDILKALVNKCPDLVNSFDFIPEYPHKRVSPLFYGCYEGHKNIVKFLLENGADPNVLVVEEDSISLLVVAILRHNTEITELLLKAGADPHVMDNSGFNALMHASSIGKVEEVKLLLSYNADYKHIRLESGIPVDAFAHACVSGSEETVEIYLSDTDLSDKSLSIGWYIACLSNKVHLIGYLVNSLPELSIGKRELVTACVEGDLACIRNNLGNPDGVFVHGVTSLMIACSCDNTSIVEALLNAGASAVKEDEFGKKAIDYCKKHSSIPDILQGRFGNEPIKRTFDKEKLFEDIIPVTTRKGILAIDEHLPLSNFSFTL